jgi:transposase
MEKIDARELITDAQQQLRYQVIRLRKQGLKFKDISKSTGVSRSTYNTWWSLYKNEEKKHLKLKGVADLGAVTAD